MISRPLQILSFLLLLTPSCSVKEVRSGCPCLLEVDLSTADKGKGDINISTDGFNEISLDSQSAQYTTEVQKSVHLVTCIQGLKSSIRNGLYIGILEGDEADSLMVSSQYVDCTGETAFTRAVFHKWWSKLTIHCSNPGKDEYPYEMVVTGETAGVSLKDRSTLTGKFRYVCKSTASDRNVFTAVLPRQDSLEPHLKLLLMPKDGKSVEKEYDLYEIFRKKGYDWNADDLDDISIGINYSGDLTYLSIIDWENGMETSVII